MSDSQLGFRDDASPTTPGALDDAGVASLITALYNVRRNPSLWEEWVHRLSGLLGGAAVLLALGYRRSDDGICVVSAEIDLAYRQRYARHYHAHDPWVERAQGRPAGVVGFGYEWLPRPLLIQSAFYSEWLKPQGLQPTPCIRGVLLTDGARPVATVSIFRRHGGPALGIAELARMRGLMPHLQRAVRADQRIMVRGGTYRCASANPSAPQKDGAGE